MLMPLMKNMLLLNKWKTLIMNFKTNLEDILKNIKIRLSTVWTNYLNWKNSLIINLHYKTGNVKSLNHSLTKRKRNIYTLETIKVI